MRGKDEMSQDAVIEKIFNMGQVSAILHTVRRFTQIRSASPSLFFS